MSDIIALLEENKRLQATIDEMRLSLAKPSKAVLYAKKAKVMGLLSRVKESGKHQQGWTYATSEDIKDVVRKAMSEAGLSLSFELVDYEMERGDKRMVITGRIAFTLECGETGASEEKMVTAEAVDYVRGSGSIADKTFFKLYTTAEKYFLKTTFLISSGDELDSDSDKHPESSNQHSNQPDNRPWQEKSPRIEEFLAMARQEFRIDDQDIKDELKAAGYSGYKSTDAPQMWQALEKASKQTD